MPLQNGRDAFEAHAGVDRRPRQRSQLAVQIAVELHEDEIPDFDETAAAIERKLLVLTALFGGFGPKIVMNFRAGSARTGLAHLPEVVFFVQPENAVFRNTRDFLPKLFGIIVFAENGDVEADLSACRTSSGW